MRMGSGYPGLRNFMMFACVWALTMTTMTRALAQDVPLADTYVWKNVRVGAGGFIPGIVFSRVEPGLAYLRSDMGGAYRWDDADQTWVPMHDHVGVSSYFGTESVAPDPVDADVVYLAVGMYRNEPSAIMRSRDRGQTWDIFEVPFMMGGNEDGRGLGERLAVDPSDTSILYFGSRHDGLWRSEDHGETWTQVETFPLKGNGAPKDWSVPTNGGLSFVVFDPRSGSEGTPTQTLFVGNADAGEQHLFRSDDAGRTWHAVEGEPKDEFLPAKAEIDDAGVLYLTYANGIGPNGVTDGAVMKLNTDTGEWTDITPDKSPDRGPGGYMGLSLDRQQPGVLGITTMNRWGPVDTVWRSTDGGQTWMDIVGTSERDVSVSPFLLWGDSQAKLGWWMAAFALDPFNSDHAAYATGATIYATKEFSHVNRGQTSRWSPWVEGIEQTAVITICSPPEGPHLISGFGDIGGFVHDDFDVSPPDGMFQNPRFDNTNTIYYAGQAPNVIVRSAGRVGQGESNLGYSEDSGRSWQPLEMPPADPPADNERRRREFPALITSADGATFMVLLATPQLTRDRGESWTAVEGLPERGRPVADMVNADRFYAMDFDTATIYASDDGGATFTEWSTEGLPADISEDRPTWSEAEWPLHATPGREGDLWFVSKQGLYHSTDGGLSFEKVEADAGIESLTFGKAAEGSDDPTLFAVGWKGTTRGILRSDDLGVTWQRVNDDQHQWGTRFRRVVGDPRVFGRVYLATDGRGILYGEPAGTGQ